MMTGIRWYCMAWESRCKANESYGPQMDDILI
jgi:hypothetical protein